MLSVYYRRQFKKDYERAVKCGCNPAAFQEVLARLIAGEPLPEKFRDHRLVGNYKGYRECHITADWLLIYKVEAEILTLTLVRTGTHSDLF